MKLQDYATISAGTLTSRLKEDEAGTTYKLYDNQDFNRDSFEVSKGSGIPKYYKLANDSSKELVQPGEVVISLTAQKAAVVQDATETYLLTFNFCKVKLNEKLDARYFVYWFNHSNEARRQIHRDVQTATQIKKISINSLRNLEINFPPIEEQQRVGKVFELFYKKRLLESKKNKLQEQYLLAQLLN